MSLFFCALTGVYFLMSAVAYAAFAHDKKQAVIGGFRTRERTLLLLSALFGAPGALLAMRRLHHKTLHKKFTITVPVLLALQIALWGWTLVRAFF